MDKSESFAGQCVLFVSDKNLSVPYQRPAEPYQVPHCQRAIPGAPAWFGQEKVAFLQEGGKLHQRTVPGSAYRTQCTHPTVPKKGSNFWKKGSN